MHQEISRRLGTVRIRCVAVIRENYCYMSVVVVDNMMVRLVSGSVITV